MQTGALIVAAGKSSRMGDFKPMLQLGSISIAQRVINNFRQAGISKIVVVTGYRADVLERHLASNNVIFLRNEDYAELLRAHNESLIRSEIHIQLAREKVFFDEQLYSLLTLIQETGSVRDACEHMHISYSTSWNLIRTLESQLHKPLVSRSQGGVNGSHSELTPYGEEFLKRYARFSEETRNCSEKIFENCFRGFFNA